MTSMTATSVANAPAQRPAPVSLSQAFWFWLKLGFISFGGPAGQIAIMHNELVERRRWISEKRFLHALNYCMVLPGPEAQQLATYIGWLMHRSWGGLVAGGLFVLPSLFILITLSWIYMAYGQLPIVAGIFYGIKPAVTAVVLHAAWRIGSRALRNGWLWGIAALAFVGIFVLRLPFPVIVLGAAIMGALGGRFKPAAFAVGGRHGTGAKAFGPALIDDDTPTPAHARFSRARLVRLLLVALALWAGAMGVMGLLWGWQGTLSQMGWFFTKAALLTFGGAYAVLPYVYQGAVEHYQWLSATQMIDGLALGETTPGPLIMVVAYVLHLPALVRSYPCRWSGDRDHARQSGFHRAADRDHSRRGRRDPEPGAVLCLACLVAAGFFRCLRPGRLRDHRGRGAGTVPIQGRRDDADRRVCDGRSGQSHGVALMPGETRWMP